MYHAYLFPSQWRLPVVGLGEQSPTGLKSGGFGVILRRTGGLVLDLQRVVDGVVREVCLRDGSDGGT
jgi:hypothetical protein